MFKGKKKHLFKFEEKQEPPATVRVAEQEQLRSPPFPSDLLTESSLRFIAGQPSATSSWILGRSRRALPTPEAEQVEGQGPTERQPVVPVAETDQTPSPIKSSP